MSVPVIEFSGTVKAYGEKRIGPVELSVEKGEIFGFLGPNGSGKTTCIRMLLGLAKPSAGKVRLRGLDPLRSHVEALTGVGYSAELPNIQTFLTPKEVLRLGAAEVGLKIPIEAEVDRVLEEVGIIEYGDVRVGKLSKEMVQRLSVAQAIIGSPEIMVMDEPTIGLDPAGTAHPRETFRNYARDGGTILMSSHMMTEVEELCLLAMVVFTVMLDTVPYYILSTSGTAIIPAELFPYLWVAGVFAPFTLFIQFIALLIATGAMSEEYETGTAELLLSKPVSRTEFFVGKFLGGYLLLAFLIALNAGLSVIAVTLTYGTQAGILTLPGVILVEVYASTLFYSVSFMVGELVRRSSFSCILSSAVIVSSQIIGVHLSLAYELTRKALYQTIHVYLPTTIVGSLPPQYEQPLLPSSTGRIFQLILGPSGGTPSEGYAAALIAVYFIVATSVALVHFRYADVARRVS